MALTLAQYNDLIKSFGPPPRTPGAGTHGGADDRRAAPRRPSRKAAYLFPILPGNKLGELVRAKITNATTRGINLLHPLPLAAGSAFMLHFPRLGDQPVTVRCTVRSCEPCEGGSFRVAADFEDVVSSKPPGSRS